MLEIIIAVIFLTIKLCYLDILFFILISKLMRLIASLH